MVELPSQTTPHASFDVTCFFHPAFLSRFTRYGSSSSCRLRAGASAHGSPTLQTRPKVKHQRALEGLFRPLCSLSLLLSSLSSASSASSLIVSILIIFNIFPVVVVVLFVVPDRCNSLLSSFNAVLKSTGIEHTANLAAQTREN
ncbi:hypothetical protein K456DRAFT_822289 [Colletotrichum gloeosporioides 23]|nr:hypothetical protein K456DRAFT_822289 [Colletotrichum gloeosporioides 23]